MSIRIDLAVIANLVKEGSKVLDVGCGDGTLLEYLKTQKNVKARGLELDNGNVTKALKKGISVIHGDADNDLNHYPSNAFDYVIMSQTLQATKQPHIVLKQLQRIGRFCIISIPNFGYIENRLNFLFKGAMPVTKTLSYSWYDTPNIHFCTIKDFINLAQELNYKIDKQIFVNDIPFLPKKIPSQILGNIFAKYGIFLLERGITISNPKPSKVPNPLKDMKLASTKNYARKTL